MIGHSLSEYVFIRICIFALRLIAPLSILHLFASWYRGEWVYSRYLGYYAVVEATFYLGVYLPRCRLLQQPAIHPTPLTRAERESLFAKCFATARDTESATGWFLFAPSHTICRDNVVEWLLWALYSSPCDALVQDWEEELEGYVNTIEQLLGRKLEEGINKDIKCMKITLDPVISLHRPLLWYFIVAIVDSCTATFLWSEGFTHYTQSRWYHYFPPRLRSSFSKPSPHSSISYWYRPHRSKTKHPILFLHGIGIGLWPYTPFLSELIKSDPDVGIIVVENLPISMRISPPPLTRIEMLEGLSSVLAFHSFTSYTVIGHSYGTVIAAHMLRSPAFSSHVASWILVDPIPFLLHQPSVAYNFVYRTPKTANEWQLWYFASRDPDIARTLARHFFWTENILWKEDLRGRKVGVALSGRDQIVDAEKVRRYLTEEDEASPLWSSKDKDDREGRLEVLWSPDLDHASIFDKRVPRKMLRELVERFIVRDDPEE
ncbi:hypothetical protein BDY19DRAFT_998779 [Irpex rosettiformis]|uniref:Uncharacterized protein n=1 Tax=Irpex rosettiformis TaxID=378272 RepID=A0ACB8TMH5_9APHY|nr:hypothetical protein BDY19DRAFT_998779 [Irpex rosettiformis]